MSGMPSFFEELKRRNVVRVGVVYLITAWLLAQVADLMLENFNAPDWVIQAILVVLIIGFPLALVFAWAYELTPEGLKKEKDVDRTQSITPQTGRKLDFIIIGVLAIALGYFIWESRFAADHSESESNLPESAQESPAADSENLTLTPSQKSIAVLPFVNMSSDPEQEYFSDGISEEILNSLAKVQDLKVAGRTSSFAFKGQNQDLRQVGQALGVEHILEGSVRKSGTKVRITAQLIQVEDGFHLWSDSYDRELTDVFAIQDEIATAILEQLKAHLLEENETTVAATRANAQAYDLYLLAKQRMYERTGPTIESAVELLDRAIALDPGYAPAHAQRAIATLLLSEGAGSYGNIPLNEALVESKRDLDRALELDPELAEAWAGLGLYHNNRPLGLEAAIEPLRKALALNPSLIDARNWLNIALLNLGRVTEARAVVLEMVERDPLYRPGVRNMVNMYNWFGQYAEAEAFLDRVRPLIPNDATILSSEAAIAQERGDYVTALQRAEEAVALQPSNSVIRLTRGFALMATQQLERVVAEGEEWQPIPALVHLGRTEEAGLLAQKRVDEIADAGTWINFLNLAGRSEEAARYIDERWPDLDALERDIPPYGGLGYLAMLDVALAYSRTRNAQGFDDAMARIRRVGDGLLAQGVNNPTFFMSEAAFQAMAGDPEASLENLQRAIDRGFITLTPRIARDWPYLEPLQGDPRFEAIQERMIEHVNAERAALGLEPVSA